MAVTIIQEDSFRDFIIEGSIYKKDIEDLLPNLYETMRNKELNVYNTNDCWDVSYKHISGIIIIKLDCYNRGQIITWDILNDCKADIRTKKYSYIKNDREYQKIKRLLRS
jgi:hypothetical protein